jgi:hypothetical protein
MLSQHYHVFYLILSYRKSWNTHESFILLIYIGLEMSPETINDCQLSFEWGLRPVLII